MLINKTYSSIQDAEASSKIYLINCLSAIQQPLVGHEVAANYVNNLASAIEMHVSALTEREVDAILRRCGLSSRMSYVQKYAIDGQNNKSRPLAELEEMLPPLLFECLRTFFGLVTGTEGSLPEFEQLQVTWLLSDACTRMARALAEAYHLLYKVVTDPKNNYPDPRTLMRHSPDQIRTMLGI